ncbi:MAG: hypothetical protein KatS3mg054_1139 [Chloroflexus sp.]|jgi:hypothetical protein|uniref:Uncharacterized protein n=1 Tax=Chloroflexus aurantiacus (strain ATCC 29366 / DSM 635 / J-10-fl) TaxID=324602 RepID=A9WBA5_CHLAA|nr:hypothetical protein [Chloroflexus aurantiacus]ABY33312.1 conserved hypothetical protein [Chloroflexus aurantiacus J-10-fl]RMG51261.1 MAG: hypothetical protein D6716_06445 [Chloroflexota bacterium]GIV87110.1 MAG: hypothetical protein KatS3mg054_1139 [Chloroflexus sp.]HBW68411.1 hypothetical protein [Chloroflexus aurantiacus]
MNDGFTFTVEIFTPTLLCTGSYTLPMYRRVSDALNNRLSRFVNLHDVSIAPLWRPQQAQRVQHALVAWGDALLVAVLAEPEPPPDYHPVAPPRETHPVMFFTAEFAVRAEMYKRPDMDLEEMLSGLTDDFIPLRNVTIFPINGGAPLHRSFVCLAQRAIQVLYSVRGHTPADHHSEPPADTTATVPESNTNAEA